MKIVEKGGGKGHTVKNAYDILQRKSSVFLFTANSFLGMGYQVQT